MVELFLQRASQAYKWYSTWSQRRVARFLRTLLMVAVVATCTWFIWQQASTGVQTLSIADLRVSPYRILVSWLCITAATALGAWEWVLLVNALGGDLDIRRGMAIHLTSILSKYLPGMIWPYAGKAYLAAREGIRASIATLSVVGEFGILYFTGALLMLMSLPFSGLFPGSTAQRGILQGVSIALTVISISAVTPLGRLWACRMAETKARPGLIVEVRWPQVALIMIAVLATWGLLGLGFSILYGPATSGTGQDLARHTFVLAAALLIGQVAFFLPTGLGLRETIFVALLTSGEDAAVVLVLAVLFRILMLAGELLTAAVAVLLDRFRRPLAG